MTDKMVLELLQKLNITITDDGYEAKDYVTQKLWEMNLNRAVSSDHGASKCCMIFSKDHFVIKWSYDGGTEATDEVDIYNKALAAGLANFFPKTELFAEINGIKFVKQEMVDFSTYNIPGEKKRKYQDISKTAKTEIMQKMQTEFDKASPDHRRAVNNIWLAMALVLYGKKVCKAFCKFAKENGINDLHGENTAFKNNRPVLLDFSGYHRNY